MTRIHHINCGTLVVAGYPTVVCHCLLLEVDHSLVLVDSGIGLLDVHNPVERLGQQLIDIAGFQFNEPDTAIRRVESLGRSPYDVHDIVLTHCDPDHTGGLADFPNATVHLAEEEWHHLQSGHWRYVSSHFEHQPRWRTYGCGENNWFGMESRRMEGVTSADIRLIPLFGHTLGHCGVAIRRDKGWLLHVGDAYYLRAELTDDDHPVSALAAQRADNDPWRQSSLAELRRLHADHSDEIELLGYHDLGELPHDAIW